MDLRIFNRALICRSLWRGVFGSTPWSSIIQIRYMKGRSIEHWLRKGSIGPRHGSPIWNSMRKVERFFLSRLCWRIHTGNKILINIDTLSGSLADLSIPADFNHMLQHHGIFTWEKLIKDWRGSSPIWKNEYELNLQNTWSERWITISDMLSGSGLHRHGKQDDIQWTVSRFRRPVTVRDIYLHLISNRTPYSLPSFPSIYWKAKCPPKLIHFAWLVFYNKNLSWDNLRKRNWHGPSRCTACRTEEETNLHMFIHCSVIQRIWYVLANTFYFPLTAYDSLNAALIGWSRQRGNTRFLILIFLWNVWKWRNASIFNDTVSPPNCILDNILSDWHMIYGPN